MSSDFQLDKWNFRKISLGHGSYIHFPIPNENEVPFLFYEDDPERIEDFISFLGSFWTIYRYYGDYFRYENSGKISEVLYQNNFMQEEISFSVSGTSALWNDNISDLCILFADLSMVGRDNLFSDNNVQIHSNTKQYLLDNVDEKVKSYYEEIGETFLHRMQNC